MIWWLCLASHRSSYRTWLCHGGLHHVYECGERADHTMMVDTGYMNSWDLLCNGPWSYMIVHHASWWLIIVSDRMEPESMIGNPGFLFAASLHHESAQCSSWGYDDIATFGGYTCRRWEHQLPFILEGSWQLVSWLCRVWGFSGLPG